MIIYQFRPSGRNSVFALSTFHYLMISKIEVLTKVDPSILSCCMSIYKMTSATFVKLCYLASFLKHSMVFYMQISYFWHHIAKWVFIEPQIWRLTNILGYIAMAGSKMCFTILLSSAARKNCTIQQTQKRL